MGKLKTWLVEFKDAAKETAAEHIEGFCDFCVKSPFMWGRYVTFEVLFAILFLYSIKTGKKLDWVDPD